MFVVFFFKQKTAYEMRISDWSSDVCSSDLEQRFERTGLLAGFDQIDDQFVEIQRKLAQTFGEGIATLDVRFDRHDHLAEARVLMAAADDHQRLHKRHAGAEQNGRAASWERRCQYV